MLRKKYFIALNSRNILAQTTRCVSTTSKQQAKDANVNRQVKVLGKLFGSRVSGSKKRWYPDTTNQNSPNSPFQTSQLSKAGGGQGTGKQNTRRMNVLNKLFMKHVTDLLATGEASETLLGRGLQITRVKISQDFAALNVYWWGDGDPMRDIELERDLRHCSGHLRHELSQLAVMGEVPRIHFVREKMQANLNHVEALLSKMDLHDTENKEDSHKGEPQAMASRWTYNVATNSARNDFYGQPETTSISVESTPEEFPPMRQDIFGLDHQAIMSKILSKMRKSQKAWDAHLSGVSDVDETVPENQEKERERLKKKLTEVAEQSQEFEKFLVQRRERKNVPERKRFNRSDHWIDLTSGKGHDGEEGKDAVMSNLQRKLMQAEDFIEEEVIEKYKT